MKCWIQETVMPKSMSNLHIPPIPQATGKWFGPYEFIQWGTHQGNTMALYKKENGEVAMAYPGMVKLEEEK